MRAVQSTPESRMANAAIKRREAKERGPKLALHPGTSDRLYDPAEEEFLMAVKAYQERTGVRFPTMCELLAILVSLGYRKQC